jgi:hypothetical protein
MSAPTSSAADEKVTPVAADMEAELTELLNQNVPKYAPPATIETSAERIRSSISRMTANSIDGLEGLTSELQELQSFLTSEVRRVQTEIESALAGIKIIVETIAPWKACAVSVTPPAGSQGVAGTRPATTQGSQYRR